MAYPNPLSGIARTVSGFSTPLNVASLLPGGNTSGLAPDAETLAKVMGGDLSGTMSTSDKLMALGALLRSAAPGSQMLPQQVMAQIKQQKIADLQNKLAIEQARKAATEEANLNAAWTKLVNETSDPNMRAWLQTVPAASRASIISKYIEQLGKPAEVGPWSESLGRFVSKTTPSVTSSGTTKDGKRYDRYSNGNYRVLEPNGSYSWFDVNGEPISGN